MPPLQLSAKEGIALLNGTQFMSAYGVYNIILSNQVLENAHKVAAVSLEAFDGKSEPFYEGLHRIRPHQGQIKSAQKMRDYLANSPAQQREKIYTQDPYSFRCIPQVHGATYDTLQYVTSVIETEINSVTDNPTIFTEEQLIMSGGNFHGQPLALALDFLSIAMAEIGSISERRTYNLISGKRGLPEFLVSQPGLNSGMMIPQYTAASIVSNNKQLATPSSIDTIPSSNGQEDHVSMGANGAVKCLTIIENVQKILGIEWLNACQALDLRKQSDPKWNINPILESEYQRFRKVVPFLAEDRVMFTDIQKSIAFLNGLE
jgi:histidine ammonia-lyase